MSKNRFKDQNQTNLSKIHQLPCDLRWSQTVLQVDVYCSQRGCDDLDPQIQRGKCCQQKTVKHCGYTVQSSRKSQGPRCTGTSPHWWGRSQHWCNRIAGGVIINLQQCVLDTWIKRGEVLSTDHNLPLVSDLGPSESLNNHFSAFCRQCGWCCWK